MAHSSPDGSPPGWYIIQQSDGSCEIAIAPAENLSSGQRQWGPYESQQEAIARRIGLIRAGHCRPQ
jgi:hypothetical protein